MQGASKERLQGLLASTRTELQKQPTGYIALLGHLEILERSLDDHPPDISLVQSVLNAFPAGLRPTRAATPSSKGLKEARLLWVELNHIVKSRPSEGTSKT